MSLASTFPPGRVAAPAISFRDITKTFSTPKGPFQALGGVSFEVDQGEIFGLLGPNGAGKTTLISILAGLTRASSGSVSVLGHDVVTDYTQSRRLLGVVPQELVFDPFFSLREALRIQSGYFGIRRNDDWIDIQSGYFGIRDNDDWIDDLLHSLGLADKAQANMRQLSVHRPPVIVLDEPTAGVDVELRQTLWQFVSRLNREGSTVLLTTHYLEEAEALCGRIAMIKRGQVVALEKTSALLSRASSNVLRFKTTGSLPPELAAKARVTGRVVQLPAHDAAEVEHTLAVARQAGLVVEDIEIRKADLEDVFLDVMAEGSAGASAPSVGGSAS